MEGLTAVIDACVAIKWFVEESGTQACLRLLELCGEGKISLVAPDFLLLEVANVMRYRFPSPSHVKKALLAIRKMKGVELVGTDRLLDRATEIAYEKGLSVYDGVYAALAEELNAPLLTYDERILEKITHAQKPESLLRR